MMAPRRRNGGRWIGKAVLTLLSFGYVAWTPAAATADWAYTHWGMTAEQVAAASSGMVTLLPVAQRTRDEADHWELAAQGMLTEGALHLPVGFTFDTRTGGLKCVMYNARDADVEAIHTMLVKRYGKPANDSRFGAMQMVSWRQPDAIELDIAEQPLAAVVSHCAPR